MREMKDSGISWVGEMPANWNSSKVKYVSQINSGEYIDKSTYEIDGEYPVIGSNGEIGRCNSCNNHRQVITTGRVGSIGTAHIVKDAWITDNTLVIKTNKNISQKYLYYVLPNFDYQDISSGTAQPLVTASKLKQQAFVMPDIKQQNLIISFLDTKCAEIDALSSDIQSEIDTLEAYKRSVITEVVTKGLDKTVPMKDSGIEWVGEIPETWNVHPVYVYFGERKNKNYALQEQNLLSLSYGKIIRKDIDTVGGLLPASFNTYNIVEAGDIIIRPTDLQNDKRSLRTGLVTEKGIITSAYIDLAPKGNINSAYFHYLLHSYDVQKVFYNMGNGVRQGMNYSEFSKLMVFAPSRDEQDSIVDYLNNKCAEIEAVIAQKQEQLAVLADYKKSVIYEYVTGKKEVPVA